MHSVLEWNTVCICCYTNFLGQINTPVKEKYCSVFSQILPTCPLMRMNCWTLTLRKEEAATLPAATMKSIISMVAPGKLSEKNWGEQCLMIVLTISLYKEELKKKGKRMSRTWTNNEKKADIEQKIGNKKACKFTVAIRTF